METVLAVVAALVVAYFIYSRIQIGREEKKNRSDRAKDRYTPPKQER